MFAIAIIIFREIIEITLILGIIASAIKDLSNRRLILALGTLTGVILSVIFAFSLGHLSDYFDGCGQEIFNAAVCLCASAFIAHTVIWMQNHPKVIAANLKKLSSTLSNLPPPLKNLSKHENEAIIMEKANNFIPLSIIFVIAATIFREGGEIILFTAGIYSAHKISISELISGVLIGSISGTLMGYLIYKGLSKLSLKHFFRLTSILLILLAANMAARAAHNLSMADILPEIIPHLWDSSALIAQNSFLGNVLNNVIGYVEKPSLIEIIFYFSTIVIIHILKRYSAKSLMIGVNRRTSSASMI